MPPKRKSKKRSRRGPLPEELIDENHKEEILEAFRSALKKRQKTLSISDSKKSLKTLGIDAKSDEIETFVQETELDENSFLRFAATKLLQIENAHKAFALIDKDEKGVVVLQDLQRVSQELGENFTEEELTEMIQLVDRGGDGLLSAKDFVRIARKVDL